MKIKLTNENREFELPDDDPVVASDQALREFLGSLAPQYAQAVIQRVTTPEGVEVRVAPRAGQKGSIADVATALLSAPETIPEALLLAWDMQESPERWPLERRLQAHQSIGDLLAQAAAERKEQGELCRRLKALPPAASQEPPLGF
jgi:hypothetical protein